VEATDTDKRGELALSSLSEHLSGESKVGFNKSAALALNSLDKRELLSLWITLWITYPQAALRVNTLCVLENKSLTKERTVTMRDILKARKDKLTRAYKLNPHIATYARLREVTLLLNKLYQHDKKRSTEDTSPAERRHSP
jgi:hypothetical protein